MSYSVFVRRFLWRTSALYGRKSVFVSLSCRRQIYICGKKCQRRDGPRSLNEDTSKPHELTVEDKHTTDEQVPLIVRLLRKNQQHADSNHPSTSQEVDKLSLEDLRTSLEDISWDTQASIRRGHLGSLEAELLEDELNEKEDESDQQESFVNDSNPEMSFIEDIYLDDDVAETKKISKSRKGKHLVKGSPDPSVPKSGVPCSGCGADLHCQDPIIPGYMPSEKFKCLTKKEMETSRCQRCYLITVHNMYLNVKVPANIYPKIMSEIKHTHALVLLVVDLFDMENSVFKNLLNYIGKTRPLFIVGNKVDLIPRDRKGYLEKLKERLFNICDSAGLNPTKKNIKHVCLVSAKTGYGIEELITKLMKEWKLKGDVFVVGCTNVGKSTLFNALLMSDYCKSIARSHINRATVSVWPGTTLNLLRFPIVNPEPWRLMLRTARVMKDRAKFSEEEWMQNSQSDRKTSVLKGHVGITDFRGKKAIAEDEARMKSETICQDIVSFSLDKEGKVQEISGQKQIKGFNPTMPEYNPESMKLYWAYDTPGVINPEQIINLLEPEELAIVLPKSFVQPRCLVLKPGQVLFISGMGRIDYFKGNTSIYLTVHCCNEIPLHVKDGHEADNFYQQAWGSSQLGVPLRHNEHLLKIPSLVGREFEITGIGWKLAAADIHLSSLGWVSVAAGQGMGVQLRAFTPGARGLHLRSPSLLPEFTGFRGKRKGKTPFYNFPGARHNKR